MYIATLHCNIQSFNLTHDHGSRPLIQSKMDQVHGSLVRDRGSFRRIIN